MRSDSAGSRAFLLERFALAPAGLHRPGFVRTPLLAVSGTKGALSGIHRAFAQFSLDPQQLVVLCRALAPARRARLDLSGVGRNRKIGNGHILGFPGTV